MNKRAWRDQLFLKRLGSAWWTGFRYTLAAISGGNFLGILLLAAFIAIYYKTAIDWVSSMPYADVVLAVGLAAVVTPSMIRSFHRAADTALLAPSPYPISRYLKWAWGYSLLIQWLRMLILAVILSPLFAATSATAFSWFVIGFVVLKLWNMDLQWQNLKAGERWSFFKRWIPGAILWSGIWVGNGLLIGSAVFLMISLTGVAYLRRRSGQYPWSQLIEAEKTAIAGYYTILNWFLDVPSPFSAVQNGWIRRLLLQWIQIFQGRKRSDAYLFLLARSLLRSREIFTMFIRLTAVVLLVLFAVESSLAMYVVCLLGLGATGSQMIRQLRLHIEGYPVTIRLLQFQVVERQQAARKLSWLMLSVVSVALSVMLLLKTPLIWNELALIAICFIWSAMIARYLGRKISANPLD